MQVLRCKPAVLIMIQRASACGRTESTSGDDIIRFLPVGTLWRGYAPHRGFRTSHPLSWTSLQNQTGWREPFRPLWR